jgi:hypothetical protein
MNIRYKVVGGREGEEICPDAEALEAIQRTLTEYEKRGHHVRHIGNEYVVEDSRGDTVATYELLT